MKVFVLGNKKVSTLLVRSVSGGEVNLSEEVAGREVDKEVEGNTTTNNTISTCMPEDLAEHEGVPRGWEIRGQ